MAMASVDTRVGSDPRPPASDAGSGERSAARRVTALDGVRGIAVLLVLVGHAFPRLWLLAATGVTVFFVLSGYLITGILLRDHDANGRVNLRRFYVRRVFRLAPTLLLVLSVTVAWCVAWKVYETTLARDAVSTLTYRANWGVESGDFTLPLAQTWSLSVEEQFYFVWPVLLLLLGARRHRLVWLAAGLALVSLGWRLIAADSSLLAVLYGSVSVAFALLVGCLIACLDLREPARWLRPASVAALVGVPTTLAVMLSMHLTTSWVVAVVLPVVAVATALAVPRVPLARFVSSRPLVWFGGISYALYLWQTPVEYNGLSVFRGGTPAWLVIAVAVPLAWLTTRFVERPLTSLGRRLSLKV
jgi:peptidoglycan/LPS O-acetylase OafA/YrhL